MAGGIATDCSKGTGTVQLGYAADQWGIAAAYNYTSEYVGAVYAGTATPLATFVGSAGNTNSFGLSGYWSPEESGWIPSISTGWGINSTSGHDQSKNGWSGYDLFGSTPPLPSPGMWVFSGATSS